MKRVIRRSVFDTNSSTMHTCVIMTRDQYDAWEEGHLYYCDYIGWLFGEFPDDKRPEVGHLYTQDEVLAFYEQTEFPYLEKPEEDDEYDDPKDQYIREMGDFIKYDSFFDTEYLETDTKEYTTPGGEHIVVCCKYGTDY